MTKTIITFLNVILVSLVVGTMFGIWIGSNPMDFSPSAYVEQQQNMIRHLNVLMPLLGLITIIITLIAAFIQKQNKVTFISLMIAAALLIASGLITRFGNQPINDVVMTWSRVTPPSDWEALRDKWWVLHITRTIVGLLALCLIIGASIRNNKQ